MLGIIKSSGRMTMRTNQCNGKLTVLRPSLETILPEGRGQFGKDPEKSYQDDGRIKRNGI